MRSHQPCTRLWLLHARPNTRSVSLIAADLMGVGASLWVRSFLMSR